MSGAGASGYQPGALVPLSLGEASEDLLDFVSRDHTRFGTGWYLDDQVGMVGTGEMVLVWARSGAGKSTWALNLIRNTPEVPTLVVNMEMTPRRQVEWLTAMSFDLTVPARDIENVLRADDDPAYDEVVAALRSMNERYPVTHFANPSRPAVSDLTILLDDIGDSTGVRPQRVFIDHLGLMGGCTAHDYSSFSRTSSELHSWTMNEDVALYLIQQTGRGGGDQGRNDGHIPVTLSSGVYAGEADADWVYGIYRPERDPKFLKRREQFTSEDKWVEMITERERVKNLVVFQVIKDRPYGDLLEDGVDFYYNAHNRLYTEYGRTNGTATS